MKKIAILTMNYTMNFGGVLQCIALQETLKSMGHEVEVIRFSYKKDRFSITRIFQILYTYNFKEIISIGRDMITAKFSKKQKKPTTDIYKNSREFISKYIDYTKLYNEDTIVELSEKYGAVVIGSDKIWGWVNRNKLVYFGCWINADKTDIISYAACSSVKVVPKFKEKEINTFLGKFKGVSVRDSYTKRIFQPLSKIDISVVLDPTFLYDFSQLFSVKESIIQEDYVLVYVLGKEIDGGHLSMINMIKEKYENHKVVAIVVDGNAQDIVEYADIVYNAASPDIWINLIANSKFFYTDSFHGVVFALKYRVKFLSYYTEISRSTRLIDLSDRFGLSNQIVTSVNDAVAKKSIDFNLIYKELDDMICDRRKESFDFLKANLSK